MDTLTGLLIWKNLKDVKAVSVVITSWSGRDEISLSKPVLFIVFLHSIGGSEDLDLIMNF